MNRVFWFPKATTPPPPPPPAPPLPPSLRLTDAEREAIAYFAVIEGDNYLPAANTAAATLRKLLERMK